MNRRLYWTLWVLEVASIVMLGLALTVPFQHYALPEFLEWQRHPAPETYRAFLEKQRQEPGIRLVLAAPFLTLAVVFGGWLAHLRKKNS